MSDSFGSRLRAARLAAGLTQFQLAGDLMTPSHMSLLERDRRRPSAETLQALVVRLGVTPEELACTPEAIGRPRSECRLVQAERALAAGDCGRAERLATQVICSQTHAGRRMDAFVIRAAARSTMLRTPAALADLGAALAIAQRRGDTRSAARIAIERARLERRTSRGDAA